MPRPLILLPLLLTSTILASCENPSGGDLGAAPTEAGTGAEAAKRFQALPTGESYAINGLADIPIASPPVEKSNGQITWGPHCTAAQKTKIQSAMTLEQSAIASPNFTACLMNGYMAYDNGEDVENIVKRLREDLPTTIDCGGGGAGSTADADTNVTYEKFMLSNDALASDAVQQIAGTIAHEVAHTKGWQHPEQSGDEYEFTVPYVVGACAESIAWNDPAPYQPRGGWGSLNGAPSARIPYRDNRALMPAESYSARVGFSQAGTTAEELRCPAYEFATAIATGGASPSPGGLAFNCFDGSAVQTALYLGSFGSSAAASSCAAGELLIGITGSVTAWATAVDGLCEPISTIAAGTIAPTRVVAPEANPNPLTFTRVCPPGMAIDGIDGRAGTGITGLGDFSIHCSSITKTETKNYRYLSTVGFTGAYLEAVTDILNCDGPGAYVGFVGGYISAGLTGLGGVCAPMTLDTNGLPVRSNDWLQTFVEGPVGDDTITSPSSGLKGHVFPGDQCAADQTLIGLNVYYDAAKSLITSVQGVCANAKQWNDTTKSAPTQTALQVHGPSSGTRYQPRCNRGELLHGVAVRTGESGASTGFAEVVLAVTPVCRDFRAR